MSYCKEQASSKLSQYGMQILNDQKNKNLSRRSSIDNLKTINRQKSKNLCSYDEYLNAYAQTFDHNYLNQQPQQHNKNIFMNQYANPLMYTQSTNRMNFPSLIQPLYLKDSYKQRLADPIEFFLKNENKMQNIAQKVEPLEKLSCKLKNSNLQEKRQQQPKKKQQKQRQHQKEIKTDQPDIKQLLTLKLLDPDFDLADFFKQKQKRISNICRQNERKSYTKQNDDSIDSIDKLNENIKNQQSFDINQILVQQNNNIKQLRNSINQIMQDDKKKQQKQVIYMVKQIEKKLKSQNQEKQFKKLKNTILNSIKQQNLQNQLLEQKNNAQFKNSQLYDITDSELDDLSQFKLQTKQSIKDQNIDQKDSNLQKIYQQQNKPSFQQIQPQKTQNINHKNDINKGTENSLRMIESVCDSQSKQSLKQSENQFIDQQKVGYKQKFQSYQILNNELKQKLYHKNLTMPTKNNQVSLKKLQNIN